MEFSNQQKQALLSVREWLNDALQGEGSLVYRLFGFAGTGKTTIARHLGDMVDKQMAGDDALEQGAPLEKKVQYAAFTGKAAVVMQRKGCVNARTLHSLIYTTHDKNQDTLTKLQEQYAVLTAAAPIDAKAVDECLEAIEHEKESLKQPGFALKPDALLVRHWDEDYHSYVPDYRICMFIIDECSMVDARLGSDILSFKVPVLVLGDPAQLPPVGGGGYFTNAEPDFLLTEIHRQAEGDPILDLAHTIRTGGTLQLGTYGESRVCTREEMTQDDWLNADQILVGKNATRHGINRRCRELLGYHEILPEPGERLVCLKNNSDDGLLNGSLWECIEARDNGSESTFMLHAKSLDDDDREITVPVLKAYFLGQEPDDFEAKRLNIFNFGYALTVHKAQGSQWDTVILMDEWNSNDRAKWLYTGVTRAAKSITVVRK